MLFQSEIRVRNRRDLRAGKPGARSERFHHRWQVIDVGEAVANEEDPDISRGIRCDLFAATVGVGRARGQERQEGEATLHEKGHTSSTGHSWPGFGVVKGGAA